MHYRLLVHEIGSPGADIATVNARNRYACRGIVAVGCDILQRSVLAAVIGAQELERELVTHIDSF